MVHQIAQIIVPPEEKRSATFRAYTAKASKEEKKERGLLFAAFAIDYYHHRNDEILDGLVEELTESYYDTAQQSDNPEALLEETLRLLNTTLAHLIKSEQIFLNLKRFHAVIGVVRDRSVTFTQVGTMRAFLYHKSAKEKQQLIDIVGAPEEKKPGGAGSGSDKKTPPPAHRIFSNVFSGTLRTGDVFLAVTPSLFEYVTEANAAAVFAVTPVDKALNTIKKLLHESKQKQLGTMVYAIRLAPEHEEADHGAKESLKELFNTKEQTHALLAPSAMKNSFTRAKTLGSRGEHWLRTILRIDPNASRMAILTSLGARGLAFVRALLRGAVMIGRALVHMLRALLALFRTSGDWKKRAETLAKQSRAAIAPLTKKMKGGMGGLSIRHRALIIAGVLVLVLFIGSITVNGVRQQSQLATQTFQQKRIEIQDRLITAETSKIFKDETKTRGIYMETLALVRALPQKTDEQRAVVAEFEGTITDALEALRRARRIAKIDVLLELKDHDPLADPSTLLATKDFLFIANATRPKILKIVRKDKTVSSINTVAIDLGGIMTMLEKDKSTLLVAASNALGTLGITTDKVTKQTRGGENQGGLDDAVLYGDRLYVLDVLGNAIWRHNAVSGGFTAGTSWLEGDAALTNATDIGIDGSVWIAFANDIQRFVRGKREPWPMQTDIDPKGLSIQKIIVSEEGTSLFALDTAEKRLLEFRKEDGRLLAQYPLPAEEIRDAIIDPETKVVTLLTPTRVLEVTYE